MLSVEAVSSKRKFQSYYFDGTGIFFKKTSGFSTSRPRTKGNINYAQIMDPTNRPVSLQAHFKLAPNDIFELRQPLVEVKNLLHRNVIAPMKNPTPLQIRHDYGSSWTCPPFNPQRIIGWWHCCFLVGRVLLCSSGSKGLFRG